MASGKRAVRRVDHFYVPLHNAADGFAFLSETLRLPVVWPFTDYGVFASGGVHLGNTNLEIIKSTDAFLHGVALRPARVRGIAFETDLDVDHEFGAELDERGIPHTPPTPLTPPGADGPAWTNVGFGNWLSISGSFACKYHFIGVEQSRRQLRKAFDEVDGGTLGLDHVEELVFGAPDLEAAVSYWQNVLDPESPAEPGLWRLGDGPAIRLVEADDDGVQQLVLRVRSAEQALAALGSTTPEQLDGLMLELRE